MVISDRDTLKNRFQPGRYLSAQDFSTLIDSMLNKRADHFHGVWQQGRSYCTDDVVIYDRQLWVMTSQDCICADPEPPNDSEHWMVFPDDGDWVVRTDEQAMWAKVFDRVGIGIGSEAGDRPQARLDVRKIDHPAGPGRWLLFPQDAAQTQATLLHYGSIVEATDETAEPPLQHPETVSYLITGLSLDDVTWCSDASRGFTFRKGDRQFKENDALRLDPTTGEVMMVVQPRYVPELHPTLPETQHSDESQTENQSRELASLGLNVETPAALFDITDPQRGHLLFLPDRTFDPTLCLLRPLPEESEQLYATLGIDTDQTLLVSNAPQGFAFYSGSTYDQGPLICEGTDVLLQVRQSSALQRPQVGIGTSEPAARLDVYSAADQAQVQLLPEHPEGEAIPAIALLQHQADSETVYLTAGLGDRVSGWVSNAEQGFVFRQAAVHNSTTDDQLQTQDCEPSEESPEPPKHLFLDQGHTHLAIRESGFVGIGTENPMARLEITSDAGIGRFLFSPDQPINPALSILKLDPEQTFTLGTSATHAVLTTDTTGGFLFKALPEPPCDDETLQPLDLEAGRTLVNISPEGQGRIGIGCEPRDYELDVKGIVQAIAIYHDTNVKRVCNTKPLAPVLSKLQDLRPITFEWNRELAPYPSEPSEPSTSSTFEPSTSEPSTSEPSTSTSSTSEPSEPSPSEQIGLLAHEVKLIFPQVVRTASDGSQSVAYANLIPVLIQAINELNRQHHTDKQYLENLIDQLSNRLALFALVLAISWTIALLGYLF